MTYNKLITITKLLTALLCLCTQTVAAGTKAKGESVMLGGEQLHWQVISGGGSRTSSGDLMLSGTVGQTSSSVVNSETVKLNQGYWQNFVNSSPQYICGDADGSGPVDLSDAVFLVNYVFNGAPAPNPLASGDVDCSNQVDLSDVVYLIAYIFNGSASPCAGCK